MGSHIASLLSSVTAMTVVTANSLYRSCCHAVTRRQNLTLRKRIIELPILWYLVKMTRYHIFALFSIKTLIDLQLHADQDVKLTSCRHCSIKGTFCALDGRLLQREHCSPWKASQRAASLQSWIFADIPHNHAVYAKFARMQGCKRP